MARNTRMLIVSGILLATVTSARPVAGPKPALPLGPWTCTATVDGAPANPSGFGITSDGKGAYLNGVDSVYCLVYLPAPYSSASTAGSFMLYGMSGNTRRGRNLYYPAQAASLDGKPGFAAIWGGRLTVFGVSHLAPGASADLTALSRAGNTSQFRADGGEYGAITSPPVSYATVTRTGACTWTILVDPLAQDSNLAFWNGSYLDKYAGVFRMPLKVTVTVKGGVPSGGANNTAPYTCEGWPGL